MSATRSDAKAAAILGRNRKYSGLRTEHESSATVILSGAKNLTRASEILRFAQNDGV